MFTVICHEISFRYHAIPHGTYLYVDIRIEVSVELISLKVIPHKSTGSAHVNRRTNTEIAMSQSNCYRDTNYNAIC